MYPLLLTNASAEVYIPDGAAEQAALSRVTHLALAAHQDDIEIMAYHGIAECFGSRERWFGGAVVGTGGLCPRAGAYAEYTEEQMLRTRRLEQKKAAVVGEYGFVALLDHPPLQVRDPANPAPTQDLQAVLKAVRPEVVYTHNLADKHPAHLAVAMRAVAALRALPAEARPRRVLGCEVWRDLDWLSDEDKVVLDVQGHENLAASLLGLYDSQIDGGKRYDLAATGRRRAHATYHEPLATDRSSQLSLAVDLTPLVTEPDREVGQFVAALIDRLRGEVLAGISQWQTPPARKQD